MLKDADVAIDLSEFETKKAQNAFAKNNTICPLMTMQPM